MRGDGPLTRSAGDRGARTSGAQGSSLITFPIQIFGASRVKIPPQINVLASMILIVSICMLGIGALFGARRQRRYG